MVANVIGKRNVTHFQFYDGDKQYLDQLVYKGDQNYELNKRSDNAYFGEFYDYKLHDLKDTSVLSSDYVIDADSNTFAAYLITKGDDGVLNVNETK